MVWIWEKIIIWQKIRRKEFHNERKKKKNYLDAAVRMLKALDEKSCSYDIKTDYLLERCTAAYGDEKHNFPIVYGDYYYIEAIWKLTGEELFIW